MQNNSDKFDHLIALAATRCIEEEVKAFNETDVSDVKFDAAYYRKKKHIINKYKRRENARFARTVSVRVAAAIVIILIAAGVLIGCVPKWREAIYKAFVEWYDDFFAVSYEDPRGKDAETRRAEAPETEPEEEVVVVPTYIEEVRKPRNLPEGVWEDVIVQTNSAISIDYYFNEEYLFSFTQWLLKPSDNHIDSEDVNVKHIKINGNDATAVEYVNKDERYILWNDREYSYYISSTECDIEILIGYAKSVK